MNVEAQKLEIIEWVLKLQDDRTLQEVLKVKNTYPTQKVGSRRLGCGKHIISYVADDFDATPEDFKEYMK
jgi:hypothetical protein